MTSSSYFTEECCLSEFNWKKPVLCFFKQRDPNPEIDPFVVVKAKQVTISKSAQGKLAGSVQDFFTLMGDADYLSSAEGVADRFIVCWFDDAESDMTKDLRRLRGVTLSSKATYVVNGAGKRTYNVEFTAEQGKLK
jgi:hypothetical protein